MKRSENSKTCCWLRAALAADEAYQKVKAEHDKHVSHWICHYQGSARVYALVGNGLAEAMKDLPPIYRIPVVLRDLEGLSYEEIAQVMDCPVGTVRSRIFRAREAISEQLRPLLGTSKDKRW